MNRSGSQSSSEHSQDGRLSPEPQFTSNDSPANRRKPERPPPPGPGTASNRESGSKSSFFETLDWTQETEGLVDDSEGSEWTSTSRQRYDSIDDEFGKLSTGRVQSAAGEGGRENNFFNEKPRDSSTVQEGNFFEADFSNVQELQQDDVQTGDLLNMAGTTPNVSSGNKGVNLLDTEAPEPSTLELLTGAADLQKNTRSNLLGDAFDPFGNTPSQSQTSTNQNTFDLLSSNQPAAHSQSKPSNFDAFDILGGGNMATASTGQGKNKMPSASDEFLSFTDNKAANAQTGSNQDDLLNFGGMSLNLNATSPGFGGSNPNLGGFASGGMGQQQNKGFERKPSPMDLKDPFTEFGMSAVLILSTTYYLYML